MALKNRPARTMASAFFSVALVAGLLPALPAAAYAEDQDASPTIAIQAAQDSSQLEGEEVGTTPATQSLLSQLAFRYSDYEGTQNFDYSTVIDTSEAIPTYTVTVPSTCQALYAAATLAEGVEGEITVSYTDTDGGTKTKTVPSGSAVNLRGALDSYEYATKGNSFDVKVGDQVAAHVVVVRALALSGFTVQDASGVDLTIDPEFQKPRSTRPITYEYAVSAFESNSITVKPVSHVEDATITVNGEALADGAATITPSFDDQQVDRILWRNGRSRRSLYSCKRRGFDLAFQLGAAGRDVCRQVFQAKREHHAARRLGAPGCHETRQNRS